MGCRLYTSASRRPCARRTRGFRRNFNPFHQHVVGVKIVRDRLGLPAANALTSGSLLGDIVLDHCGKLPARAEMAHG